jgi:hypothetical protein
MSSPNVPAVVNVTTPIAAVLGARRHARDIRHAEMVVVGTYATAGEMSVSSHRRYHPDPVGGDRKP